MGGLVQTYRNLISNIEERIKADLMKITENMEVDRYYFPDSIVWGNPTSQHNIPVIRGYTVQGKIVIEDNSSDFEVDMSEADTNTLLWILETIEEKEYITNDDW